MPQQTLAFPSPLVLLARLLGEPLGADPAPPINIDQRIARLAIRRHEVGGLLYATAKGGRHAVESGILAALERCYLSNTEIQSAALARLDRVAGTFAEAGISWMVLKGVPMAAALYPDPAWRSSADIDILVSPRQFLPASRAFEKLGFIASNPPLPANSVLGRFILSTVKDVKFIARDDRRCAVELHQRPLFATGRRARALNLHSIPGAQIPPIGPELMLYLILHGAVSYWARLKWLLDLLPMLAMLDEAGKHEVTRLAKAVGVEASLAASLWLLRSLFPWAHLGLLAPWLDERVTRTAVERRALRYAEIISLDNDWRSSPLDNRNLAFEACWRTFGAPSTRAHILVGAPISSMTRRIAGSIFKAERALTHCDTPPDDPV